MIYSPAYFPKKMSRNSTVLITNFILATMYIKNLLQYWNKAKMTLRQPGESKMQNFFKETVSRNGYFLKVHKSESG
jgi:hypothetical protein